MVIFKRTQNIFAFNLLNKLSLLSYKCRWKIEFQVIRKKSKENYSNMLFEKTKGNKKAGNEIARNKYSRNNFALFLNNFQKSI